MNCMRCGKEMQSITNGEYFCSDCKLGFNDLVYRPQSCDMPLPQGFGMQYGWVCPKCGRVNAPHISQCPCNSHSNTYSSGTVTEPSDVNTTYTNTPIEPKYKITSTGEIKRTTTYD